MTIDEVGDLLGRAVQRNATAIDEGDVWRIELTISGRLLP
jgi:hypothetical protein